MHEVGDSIPLRWRVVNGQRTLVDATVALIVTPPGGSPTGVDVEHESVGVYTSLYTPNVPGRHTLRWWATGAHDSSYSDVLNVVEPSAPVSLISLAEAKEHMQMDPQHDDEDDELLGFIAAASRVVEDYTKTVWARRTIVEEHVLDSTGVLIVDAAPIVSLTSIVSADDTEVDLESVTFDARNGIIRVAASGPHTITMTAGEAVIPENVRKATEIICAHLWRTQRVQTLGGGPGFGGGMEAAPVVGRGYLIPNQAAQLLGGRTPNRP